MCKKLLKGLMGGGGAPAPAQAEQNYGGGKEAAVLGDAGGAPVVDAVGRRDLIGTDPNKRRAGGVPGLGL